MNDFYQRNATIFSLHYVHEKNGIVSYCQPKCETAGARCEFGEKETQWRKVIVHDMTQRRLSVVEPHESRHEERCSLAYARHIASVANNRSGSRPGAQTERRKKNCAGNNWVDEPGGGREWGTGEMGTGICGQDQSCG